MNLGHYVSLRDSDLGNPEAALAAIRAAESLPPELRGCVHLHALNGKPGHRYRFPESPSEFEGWSSVLEAEWQVYFGRCPAVTKANRTSIRAIIGALQGFSVFQDAAGRTLPCDGPYEFAWMCTGAGVRSGVESLWPNVNDMWRGFDAYCNVTALDDERRVTPEHVATFGGRTTIGVIQPFRKSEIDRPSLQAWRVATALLLLEQYQDVPGWIVLPMHQLSEDQRKTLIEAAV